MKCPHCQFENLQGSLVCTGCGRVMSSPPYTKAAIATAAIPGNLLSGSEEELAAKAEWLAKRIQAKRALAARLSTSSEPPRNRFPSIPKIESEMSLLLGGVFAGAVALSFTTLYFNMPEHQAEAVRGRFADFVNEAKSEAVKAANADTAAVAAPPIYASPVPIQVAAMQPMEPESVAADINTETVVVPESPDNLIASPIEPNAATPASVAREPSKHRHKRHAKHRAPQLAAACIPGHKAMCSPQYVVSFKRFWGPVLEERVYPNRKMTRRAQSLWDREGKILEADGTINDKYSVKPKTFTPIPGYSVS